MPFINLWSQLMGHVPRLDPLLAQQLTNRSWIDIRDTRQWSWLRAVGVLNAPGIIGTGTVTTVQYNATVTLDAAANAALNNLNNPLITERQFRVGTGPIYNIAAYDNGASTITLDRPYMDPSGAGQGYSVYRCYYKPADQSGNTTSDFQIFRAVLNPVEGYAILGQNLRVTRMELDARDPTRGSFDLAYALAGYSVDTTGIPIFEAWPHPTSPRAYITLYMRSGPKISDNQDLPVTVSEDMVVEHALEFAYDWAIANAGRFVELKGVNWPLLKAEQKRKYDKMLLDARRRDDNLITDSWLPQLRDYFNFPPIDGKFWQSHDVSGWFEG